MKGNAPRSPITGVPGWESHMEQEFLRDLAKAVPENGIIVEIGGEFGQSASLFATGANRKVRIVTVDIFPDDLIHIHRDNLAEIKLGGRTEQIVGNSSTVGLKWNQRDKIDLLFIDGDHSYEGVQRDISAWTPHVKEDGLVVFHDCANPNNTNPHYLHFEVTRAISEWQQTEGSRWQTVPAVDTLLVFRKLAVNKGPVTKVRSGKTSKDDNA